jgi:hypothetical protein
MQMLPRFELPSRGYHLLSARVTDAGDLIFPNMAHPGPLTCGGPVTASGSLPRIPTWGGRT